ncbi:MAG: hypothetical protein C0617_01670 [Desulfuromonas sp.]|uniref:cache domain-containing protein n=1 Tax=Desulfuromonas sp. TaxID=892 RepID=UPI000CABDB3B|nr:cache domain-containing protein [Desulfuromonas sp.]PLX86312.1 MAG: hypothetical protein C0617_01670 [Desulfuromonas sp.]
MYRHIPTQTLRPLIFLLLLLLIPAGCTSRKTSIREETYARLDAIRDRKEGQLNRYMAKIEANAHAIGTDSKMVHLFEDKHRIYSSWHGQTPPVNAQQELLRIRNAIEDIYIEKYLAFHDILFIDHGGDIFYTVRKKSDYHKNIFDGDLAETALSRQLRKHPEGGFVDFENYRIAGEPSSFFVVPTNNSGENGGWFVLQFSINKINEMFSLEEGLGSTGEVFLVNRERAMLTDSRFFADSTVLRQHLSSENISAKFAEREGHKLIIDYRNFPALTSFKVVQVLGHQWLLIAKIDEDEVITNGYRRDSNQLLLRMEKMVQQEPGSYRTINHNGGREIEVDMDEFRRVTGPGGEIYTHGVRTCTAVLISYPGRFSYMAHISPNDRIYGGESTDLIGIMMKRIDDFDLVRTEKRHLQVAIISPQPNYTTNVVDAFTEWGIFLSQIKLVLNPQARHANISHDYKSGKTVIEWELVGGNGGREALLADLPTLGDLMKQLVAAK